MGTMGSDRRKVFLRETSFLHTTLSYTRHTGSLRKHELVDFFTAHKYSYKKTIHCLRDLIKIKKL